MTTQSNQTTQQHTPGPWTIRPYGFGLMVVAENSTVLSTHASEPDARLIAAAPDMLEALRKAHSAISDLDTIDNPVARAIYDLIAKATGAQS